jgi:hypothetical protein
VEERNEKNERKEMPEKPAPKDDQSSRDEHSLANAHLLEASSKLPNNADKMHGAPGIFVALALKER